MISAVMVSLFALAFFFLYSRHYLLQEEFSEQSKILAREKARVTQLASMSNIEKDEASFLHAPNTQRIKLKGVENYPEAEVMIFHCEETGRMELRVIDLPNLPKGQHYEVWGHQPDKDDILLGQLMPPVRFDSLYSLEAMRNFDVLHIQSVDPYTMRTTQVCTATPPR